MGSSKTKVLSREARALAIRSAVETGYASGETLPAIRAGLADSLGGSASSYLGTADPIYYRLVGLSRPLRDAKGKNLDASASSRSIATAVRRERDAGVRWNVLAARIEATTGERVGEARAKKLYASGGGDVETSYVGRGTRVGAPGTYLDA